MNIGMEYMWVYVDAENGILRTAKTHMLQVFDTRYIWWKIYVLVRVFCMYRVIQNDCRGFNNLSYTIHLR